MPKNLSAWPDLMIHLAVLFVMITVISQYNFFLTLAGALLWVLLALYSYERSKDRKKKFAEYCESMVGSGQEMMHYAMTNIPQAVMVINERGLLLWCNELTKNFSNIPPEQDMKVSKFWKGILNEDILRSLAENSEDDLKSGIYIAKMFKYDPEDGKEIPDSDKYFLVR